jgi:hypothetical protein
MNLHHPFGHLKHKLWPKKGSGIKLAIWPLTIKSQESTWFPYMQVVCNILSQSSWRGLQLCFKLHLNRRSTRKVMGPQSRRSLNFGNFGTPIWESRTKCHLDVGLVERHTIYYKGEGGGFPQVWAVVSLVSLVNPSCPWFVLTPKVLQLCTNHLMLIFV